MKPDNFFAGRKKIRNYLHLFLRVSMHAHLGVRVEDM